MDDFSGNMAPRPAKKDWKWQSNIYDLKVTDGDVSQIFSCAPYVMICSAYPDEDDPETVVNVEMSREFKWTEDLGWHWHKSWNLPSIRLRLTIFDKLSFQEMDIPANIQAQIVLAKLGTNSFQTPVFHEIPLKGCTSKPLDDGKVVFDSLKFDCTSYNHNGAKFHLMLLVFFKDPASNVGVPKIIFSKISPPIYVDSRIAARDKKLAKPSNDFANQLFDPGLLTKDLYKKIKGKGKKEVECKIENNIKGLYDYLTAPNIRKKIKNFLFFVLMFPKVVKIYLPSDPPLTKKEVLTIIQNVTQGKEGPHIYVYLCSEPTVQSFEYLKTIFQEIKVLIRDKVSITLDVENIPPNYKHIEMDLSYIVTYNEFYLINGGDFAGSQGNNGNSDDESYLSLDAKDDFNKDTTVENVFAINKETLERDYNLTTLQLEKVRTVNLKPVIERESKQISELDVYPFQLETLDSLKKRDGSSLPPLDIYSLVSEELLKATKKLRTSEAQQASNPQDNLPWPRFFGSAPTFPIQ